MKKTEMENKIEILLESIGYVGPVNAGIKVLELIEKQGMLPPGYMKPIPFEKNGIQCPLIPGDFKNKNGIWCTPGINEWEPENE